MDGIAIKLFSEVFVTNAITHVIDHLWLTAGVL
jgi:hypothetical protein